MPPLSLVKMIIVLSASPRSFKTAHDLTNDPIEFVNEVAVKPALAGALKTFGGREGVVDVGGRQVKKKGFVVAGLDPLNRFFGKDRSNLEVIVNLVGFFRAAEHVANAVRAMVGVFRADRDRRQRRNVVLFCFLSQIFQWVRRDRRRRCWCFRQTRKVERWLTNGTPK